MNTSKAEQERLDILARYRKLLEVWNTNQTTKDRWEVRKAFRLAADLHKNERRKSGEPFIIHPLEVATIVAGEMGLGRTSIIAALLHDVAEDTDFTITDIENSFGSKVAKIVDGLTKIEKVEGSSTPQTETHKKIVLTLSDDFRVILIKLADRLHNMRTLDAMKPEQQLRNASENLILYIKLANKLGLYNIKNELEDLSFKYTNPSIYKSIKDRLSKLKNERDIYVEKFVEPIKKPITKIFPENEIIINEKSIKTIWDKVKNQKISLDPDDVEGTFSIDIIIDNNGLEDANACWQVYAEISKIYKSDTHRLHDFIASPKNNGYKAIHAAFLNNEGKWQEVHIKTKYMQDVATRGVAALWKYKDLEDKDHSINVWLNRLKEFVFNDNNNADDMIDTFVEDFLSDEIIIITPKGEQKLLPEGATVLDFAYSIHSDLGNHCLAGSVNRQLKKPHEVLHSGDKVKIITSNTTEPSEEWFEYVTTKFAKKRIEDYIRNKRKKYHKEGEEKLREILKKQKTDYSKQIVNKLISYFKYNGKVDLFYFIATGKIDAKAVKAALTNKTENGTKSSWYSKFKNSIIPGKSSNIESKPENTKINAASKEIINSYKGDLNKLDHTVAKCCNPIPGNDVIGIWIPGQPIQIHRTDCRKAHMLMSKYGKNIIKVKWGENENVNFLFGFKIEAEYSPSLIVDISSVLYEKFKLQIRSFEANTTNGLTEINITFYISSKKRSEALKSELKKIKAVKKISRIEKIERI
jgi:GTP pyrophosphokinase